MDWPITLEYAVNNFDELFRSVAQSYSPIRVVSDAGEMVLVSKERWSEIMGLINA